MDKLEKLRVKINEIDDEIMSLLDKRFNLSIEVGKVKSISNTSVLDTKREDYILDKTSKYSHSPEIDIVYKKIMEKSKSLQRE